MTLNQIMHRAASAYPDAHILHYWNDWHERAVDNPSGDDTLAEFIAQELYETFDATESDEHQINTAVGAMRHAIDSMTDVMEALSGLSSERESSNRKAA